MYECPECGEKVDEDDVEFECPFCDAITTSDGFYTCENCGTLFDCDEELWECEFCYNEEPTEETEVIYDEPKQYSTCPECGDVLEDDSYCYSCGWPNNQGWIGENY